MMINRPIISFVLSLTILGILSPKLWANSSTAMIVTQNELQSLMDDNTTNQELIHQAWGMRNPFDTSVLNNKRVSPKPRTVAHFILQGIFLGSSKPSVIINGTVVGIGDKIKEDTVKEISDDKVILVNDQGGNVVLSLKQ